jgi:hypothetical protein
MNNLGDGISGGVPAAEKFSDCGDTVAQLRSRMGVLATKCALTVERSATISRTPPWTTRIEPDFAWNLKYSEGDYRGAFASTEPEKLKRWQDAGLEW